LTSLCRDRSAPYWSSPGRPMADKEQTPFADARDAGIVAEMRTTILVSSRRYQPDSSIRSQPSSMTDSSRRPLPAECSASAARMAWRSCSLIRLSLCTISAAASNWPAAIQIFDDGFETAHSIRYIDKAAVARRRTAGGPPFRDLGCLPQGGRMETLSASIATCRASGRNHGPFLRGRSN